MRTVWAAVLLVLFGWGPVLAETRAAFVVGNSDYENAPRLANPARDAELVAETLRGLGFDVSQHENLTRDTFARALSGFLKSSKDADVTVFYFAGHGMQYDGENFLIGTDAALRSELDIDGETIELSKVVELLERNSKAALVFIDACRDNPLATEFYRSNFSESRAFATRGLARVNENLNGSMIVFAASPGQVALDGQGENSPFAAALARHLPTANTEVLSLTKRIIADVRTSTNDQQSPIVTNDLTREVYLALADGGASDGIRAAQELALFEAATAINTERGWSIFLDEFPNGSMRDLAQTAQEALAAQQLASLSGTRVESSGTIDVTRQVAETAETSIGLTSDDARAVQAALNARGFNAGPEDGQIGRRTRQAIADFQAVSGLPSTGVVTKGTAITLGVELSGTESGPPVIGSQIARGYDPKDLAILETDKRLLKASLALNGYEFIYGFYDGRVYIAVLTWGLGFDQSQALAERAGGHMVTISDSAENDFVYGLAKNDERMWEVATNGKGTFGPMIGLRQLPNSQEPRGGWAWVTGEPLTYTFWDPNEPNNWSNKEHVAKYHHLYDRSVSGKSNSFASPFWGDLPDNHQSFVIEIE